MNEIHFDLSVPDLAFEINYAFQSLRVDSVVIGVGEAELDEPITIPEGCTLRGQGVRFDNNYHELHGTVLKVVHNKGPAVTVSQASELSGIGFDYPEQQDYETVIEYPPTVKFWCDYDAAEKAYFGNVILKDLFFYKSYCAIDARGSKAFAKGSGLITTCRMTDITMSALRYGIRIDEVYDRTFLTRVKQQPGFISHEYLWPGSLRRYAQENCIFIETGGTMDWLHFDKCCAWACWIGILINSVNGPMTFQFCDFDGVIAPILLKGSNPELRASFVGNTFTAFNALDSKQRNVVLSADSNTSARSLMFNSCQLFGPSKGFCWLKNNVSIKSLMVSNCHLTSTNEIVMFDIDGKVSLSENNNVYDTHKL